MMALKNLMKREISTLAHREKSNLHDLSRRIEVLHAFYRMPDESYMTEQVSIHETLKQRTKD